MAAPGPAFGSPSPPASRCAEEFSTSWVKPSSLSLPGAAGTCPCRAPVLGTAMASSCPALPASSALPLLLIAAPLAPSQICREPGVRPTLFSSAGPESRNHLWLPRPARLSLASSGCYFLCCLLFFCGLSGFRTGGRLVNGVGGAASPHGGATGKGGGRKEHRHGLYRSLGAVWLINPPQADRG